MTFKSMGTLAFNQDSGTAHVKDVKWLVGHLTQTWRNYDPNDWLGK